ncbi:MAG: 50S ribosomal protein L24 [Oxalobacter sp.]|jgi:large subunit ribosomal protein L24|nr:50S ribosomal protein L24 [Oxalobacter sp.]MBR5999903.1 50S ribosomal protein L24 [Oxalobacter sp.]
MKKIRKGDEVIVLTGKDKGKRGKVERVIDDRVVVAGVNVAKKTIKPNPMTGATGGIEDKLMPIHVSNVALFNEKAGKADRVGFREVDGKKVRVFKSNGEVVEAK